MSFQALVPQFQQQSPLFQQQSSSMASMLEQAVFVRAMQPQPTKIQVAMNEAVIDNLETDTAEKRNSVVENNSKRKEALLVRHRACRVERRKIVDDCIDTCARKNAKGKLLEADSCPKHKDDLAAVDYEIGIVRTDLSTLQESNESIIKKR